jgi:hypothetical protein
MNTVLIYINRRINIMNNHNYIPVQEVMAPPAAAANEAVSGETQQHMRKEALQYLPIQRKLSIGSADDPLEQEADAMADTVMRMPEQPFVQRTCTHCEEEEKVQMKPLAATITPFIQTKGGDGGTASDTVTQQINSTRGSGSNMDRPTQSFMESRFGSDFSGVKIHTGDDAVQMSRELNAQAFTVGSDIYFNSGKYNPSSDSGKHLLAHELTHTVQQGGGRGQSTIMKTGEGNTAAVSGVSATLPHSVVFSGSLGNLNLYLDTDIPPGTYQIRYDAASNQLVVAGAATNLRFNVSAANATRQQVALYQAYIYQYLANNSAALVISSVIDAPQPEAPAPPDDGSMRHVTEEEAMALCSSGNMPGIKVFPYRGTRFGAAPISAWRDGQYIVVKQPVHVFANRDFSAQTRTLPTEAFTSGVRLLPNEIVRVHLYTPHWYHLNITGDAMADEQTEFCVTGEQMLQIANASDNETIRNIGLTVLDGALFFVPVGRLLQPLARGGRAALAAAMLGASEAAPVALGGLARAGTVVVEEQIVSQVAQVPLRQTVSQTVVNLAEEPLANALGSQVTGRAIQSGAAGVLADGAARTTLAVGGDALTDTGLRQAGSRVAPAAENGGLGLFGKQPAPPSGPISAELRELYLQQFNSRWFRFKLDLYARLTGQRVDWEALLRLVESAEFREYASAAEAAGSIGYAGIVEGRYVIGMARFLRRVPVLGRSSMQHELVHMFQELTGQIITNERLLRESWRGILKIQQAELGAQVFGSPALFISFGGFIIVVVGGSLYAYQR